MASHVVDEATGFTQCNKCKEFKADSEMLPSAGKRWAVRPRCRACHRSDARRRYAARCDNPEYKREQRAIAIARLATCRIETDTYNEQLEIARERCANERIVGRSRVPAHWRLHWEAM